MRQEFVQVETKEEALNDCPWASECVEVDGGFICFESQDDYSTWIGQR